MCTVTDPSGAFVDLPGADLTHAYQYGERRHQRCSAIRGATDCELQAVACRRSRVGM